MSSTVTTLLGKGVGAGLVALVCGLCPVCHVLLALPIGVIGRLWSMSGAFPRHLLYFYSVR